MISDNAVLDVEILRHVVRPEHGDCAASQARIISVVAPIIQSTCASYVITTCLRAAHFLARPCTEPDDLINQPDIAADPAASVLIAEAPRTLLHALHPQIGVDSVFGPATPAAVQGFRCSNGLVADAIVGSATSSALAARAQP